jgi:uncharacterized membrane protein YgcG
MKRERGAFGQFIHHFRFLLIIAILVVAAAGYLYKVKVVDATANLKESGNTERVYGDKRVFDFGNRLTDSEENKLEDLIHSQEKITQSDIVIVLLNESLADFADKYAEKYGYRVSTEQWVMLYADEFWEVNRFGYDKPQVLDGNSDSGDGVCLVDNDFREPSSGKKHTWMCTTGKVYHAFSTADINSALDVFYENVDDDIYEACKDFVNAYSRHVAGPSGVKIRFSRLAVVIAAGVMFIYMGINLSTKVGKQTVTERTYLTEDSPEFYVNENIFLRKSVTSRTIETDSGSRSGGGGGGHISGGGGFHGGGGHSR